MARLTLADLPRPKAPYRPDRDAPVREDEKNYFRRKLAELEDAKRMQALADVADLTPLEAAAALSLLARFQQAQREGEVPDSLASAERYWDLRTPIIGHLWQVVEEFGPERVALVTLRPHGLLVEGRDLPAFNPKTARKHLRNHLDRAEVTGADGFLIMGLDGEFDANRGEGGLYDWHWHGIVAGDKVDALEALRKRRAYQNHRVHPLELGLSPSPRVHIQRGLVNLPTPLAYGFKGWVPHRPTVAMLDGTRDRSKTKRRIPSPYLQRWLVWMDQWKIDDLVLRNGLDITKSGFSIGSRK